MQQKNLTRIISLIVITMIIFLNTPFTIKAEAAAVKPALKMVTQPSKEYMSGDRISFSVTSPNYRGNVEYRVILYNGTTKKTSELWKTPKTGYYYSGWKPAGNYKFTINWPAAGMEPGAYSLTVLVKRAGIKTAYDSYVKTNSFWIKLPVSVQPPAAPPQDNTGNTDTAVQPGGTTGQTDTAASASGESAPPAQLVQPDINYITSITPENVLDAIKQYSPDGYYIIDGFQKDINNSTFYQKYLDTYDPVRSANTIVHELNHGFTAAMPDSKLSSSFSVQSGDNSILITGEGNAGQFYIKNTDSVTVQFTNTFKSIEIASIVSDALKGDRYNTYINTTDTELGTQQNGIYGLLDEYNSYYHGTKTSIDFYEYYKRQPQSPDTWFKYFTDVEGTSSAYYEFRYFILKYLEYAKSNHYDIYTQIMNNTAFKQAFNSVDSEFTNTMNDYYNKKNQALDTMREAGYSVREMNGYIFIGTKGISTDTALVQQYNDEFAAPEIQQIISDLKK